MNIHQAYDLNNENVPVYAFSELWSGRLYNWGEAKYEDRNRVIEKIVDQCNIRIEDISSIVNGSFHKNEDEEDYVYVHPQLNYIKFINLEFSLVISDINVVCNSKIRINPCLKDDPDNNAHYSKIWCIIETSYPIPSEISKEFYRISEQYSNKIIDIVANIYTSEIKGGAKPVHYIIIKNFGKMDDHIEKLMLTSSQISEVYDILKDVISRKALTDVVQNVINKDINDNLLSELRDFGTKNKKFRLLENDNIKGLLAVSFEDKKTTFSTLFNTNEITKSHKIIREIVLDIILRL